LTDESSGKDTILSTAERHSEPTLSGGSLPEPRRLYDDGLSPGAPTGHFRVIAVPVVHLFSNRPAVADPDQGKNDQKRAESGG
jgi:hypothetical protein